MLNTPKVKLGIIAVSRNCFDIQLATRRRQKVVNYLLEAGVDVVECVTTVENEVDAIKALSDLKGINALVVYLGNFGPEGPATFMAQKFNGPVMFVGASEEETSGLINARGDAYCGMLSTSYNLALRGLKPYIPSYPVGTPDEVAVMIEEFIDIARVIIGIKRMKIITFGPRPQDFYACNAPIKPLFDLGVEIEENSELDLISSYKEHINDPRISEVLGEMKEELGSNCLFPEILPQLAAFELTLLDWYIEHRGASKYAVFANKCWPAFEKEFGFVPCYVNSRLTMKGIPVACEVDIYGALSEYILQIATQAPVTLLDINNTVPKDMYDRITSYYSDYANTDLFMGFHCGNTPSCLMHNFALKHQQIMHSLLEPNEEPNITRGTLEGTISASDITLFRLMSTADGHLRSYIAEGEVLDIDPETFGSTGIFAIREMGRFYRYALIEKNFPHHTGVAFKHTGKILYEVLRMLGVSDISTNNKKGVLYPTENFYNN